MDDILYTGPFCYHISEFIALKRSFGYSYHEESDRLKRFDRMTAINYPNSKYISKEIADKWCDWNGNEAVGTLNGRIATIRQFTRYMAGIDNRTYVINRKLGIVPKYKPHIFSHEEIRKFFTEVDSMQFKNRPPLAHITYPVLFRVLYCCGMRVTEVCDLKVKNFEDGCLIVEHGKFGKGRIVPLHASLVSALDGYIQKVHPTNNLEDYLFVDGFDNHKLYSTKVYDTFRNLLIKAEMQHGGKGKGPRVHDFRFTFIVHRLEKWIHDNADINAWLPVLQFYVGHSDMDALGYYLQITMEVYPEIRNKIKEVFGDIVPTSYMEVDDENN